MPSKRKTVLFSGHMTDAPSRSVPRFPPCKADRAKALICKALDEWDVAEGDLCISGGARGGDILFGEACIDRGAQLELVLALPIDAFLEASVRTGDRCEWPERLERLMGRATVLPAPEDVDSADPFSAANIRMIARAIQAGQGALHVLLLWDGKAGDGPGGTADFAQRGREAGAQVRIIDPGSL